MALALRRTAVADARSGQNISFSLENETTLRIGFFTDSYRPYTSGVVRSIDLFTREFKERGHEVFIFGPDYPLKQCPKEERVFRFASIPAPTMPDYSVPIPLSAQLGSTIRRIKLEIIHVHSPFLLGRLGAYAARQYNLPLVFTFHTLYEQYAHYLPLARGAVKLLAQAVGRDFCNRCDLVVAPSRLVESYLGEIGVNTRVAVIPTGTDLVEFSDADKGWLRDNFGVAHDEKALLFVGRLGREKNIIFLLQSFYRVQQVFPRVKLIIVGSGPLEEKLRSLCLDLELEQKVIFTGLLPRRELVHCYAGADLFLFPSVTETQGLVIGEARAAGLPVVAMSASAAAEMVVHGEDGLLAEPSPAEFSAAVVRLLQDRELYHKMRCRARDNAAAFSCAVSAEKMLDSYLELLETRPPSPTRPQPV